MNFENYNKIYQEILDDENNEISANYLLNKYEIKHDEELINILNQIKKNEYISSDNMAINKLISELDEDEELLDINEIIDIKEKVISDDFESTFDFVATENKKEEIEENNINEKKVKNNILKEKLTNMYALKENINLKYTIPFLIIFLISITYFGTSKTTSQTSENTIEKVTENSNNTFKEKVVANEHSITPKEIQNTNIIKTQEPTVDTSNGNTEETISANIDNIVENQIEDEIIQTNDDNEIEAKLNHIQTYEITYEIGDRNTSNEEEKQIAKAEAIMNQEPPAATALETPTLDSLNDIDNYINELSYKDGKLLYNNNEYAEDDQLFGFKIYKLTSLYVKFEDEKNHIRKRVLFKN